MKWNLKMCCFFLDLKVENIYFQIWNSFFLTKCILFFKKDKEIKKYMYIVSGSHSVQVGCRAELLHARESCRRHQQHPTFTNAWHSGGCVRQAWRHGNASLIVDTMFYRQFWWTTCYLDSEISTDLVERRHIVKSHLLKWMQWKNMNSYILDRPHCPPSVL